MLAAILVTIFLLIIFFTGLGQKLVEAFGLFVSSSGANEILHNTPTNIQANSILKKNNFFLQLSEGGKERFLMRTVRFMNDKEFIGMNGHVVTPEMKLLISASAVQLTWGLKEYKLHHYHTIRIYPETFYSRMMETYLKGGATKDGTLFLSWKDFVAGYATPDDKYNLGLHELAHALKLDFLKGEYYDEHFGNHLESWLENAMPEFEKIRSGQTGFLRNYAGTNLHEFFAVSIEHFFEVPEDFKNALPELYQHLCFLLNINPLNKSGDFLYNDSRVFEKKPVFKKIIDDYKDEKESNGWIREIFYAICGIAVLLYFFALPLLQSVTFMPDYFAWIMIFVFGTLNFIKYKAYRELKIFSDLFFIVFSYIGIGIPATIIFFLLNYSLYFGEPKTEKYIIDSFEYTYHDSQKRGISDRKIRFTFEENELENFKMVRTFYERTFTFAEPGDTVEYKISTGLLGVPVISESKLIEITNN